MTYFGSGYCCVYSDSGLRGVLLNFMYTGFLNQRNKIHHKQLIIAKCSYNVGLNFDVSKLKKDNKLILPDKTYLF